MPSILNHTRTYMPLIKEEEGGLINHFYCSIKKDVTIGVGHYMPTANDAVQLFRNNSNALYFKENGDKVQDIEDVIKEWRVIKEAGKKHSSWKAQTYEKKTTIRITNDAAEQIFYKDFKRKVMDLYHFRPQAIRLPLDIQYVLVDTLYNAANVALFSKGKYPLVIEMWKYFSNYLLNGKIENLIKAKEIYNIQWINADPSNVNYAQRVRKRLIRFEIGIQSVISNDSIFI